MAETSGRRCWNGKSRSPSGSSAASSMSRTTASTGIWTGPRAQQGRDHLGRRARRTKRTLTYQQLHREVCRFANVLKRNKVHKGRSRHHLPADDARGRHRHARLRAHRRDSFGRLRRLQRRSPFADRITDCGASWSLPPTAAYRRGAIVPLKQNVDEALQGKSNDQSASSFSAAPTTRCTSRKAATSGGTANWNMSMRIARRPRSTASIRSSSFTPAARPANRRASCTPPAAISSAFTATTKYVFDLREEDIYWCTADIGWVTGHSYVVYGPLATGATTLMYEGAPNWPEPDRFWRMIEKYAVTHSLHRADRDPRLHSLGRPMAEETRSLIAPTARHRRRTDQSRGLDVVSRDDRRRALPDRRYLVADRDRRDHDHARCRARRRPSPGRATLPFLRR